MMVIAIVVLVLLVLYLFLIAPGLRRPDDSHLRGWLYAHRGLHDGNKAVPENSGTRVPSGRGMAQSSS